METSKTTAIKPFYAMDVLERAQAMEREGAHIIHLEVGQPDFETPQPIKDACVKALETGHTSYTHSLGIIELREAICAHYHDKYGVRVHPDQIAVTNGTSPAMHLVFSALLENNDEIILSDPHYACYPNFVRIGCGEPVFVRVHEADGFQFRIADVRAAMTERTRGLFINSPSNPAGTVLSGEDMSRLAELGVPVISDEIYHGLTYEGEEHSILEYTDNAFVLNGFSKAYAMTGLRLGYLIAPKAYMRAIQKLTQTLYISTNSITQWAGVAALTHCQDDVRRMREIFNKRRLFIIDRIKKLGLGLLTEPTGAFYVLANCKHLSEDSYKLAFEMLEKAHIGVTPGIDFGPGAEGYIRFSYANSLENIDEAMNRLERFLKERG